VKFARGVGFSEEFDTVGKLTVGWSGRGDLNARPHLELSRNGVEIGSTYVLKAASSGTTLRLTADTVVAASR
jgi:hypothetical protein